MVNFGKYSILTATEYQLKDEPDWYWKINPVTTGHELEMSKFMAHSRFIMTPDGGHEERFPTAMEIAMREIALSFGGTNIPDEEGNPILDENASIENIEEVLSTFPRSLFMEIWEAVGVAYPRWGPADPNQQQMS